MSVDEWTSAPLTGVVWDEAQGEMDTRVRNILVAALLSGRYKQGYTRLRTAEDEFTVLGVLCDLAVRAGACVWDQMENEYFIAPLLIPATGSHLPPVVRDWAKIRGTHQSQELPLVWNGEKHPIWRISDIFRVPFDEIAYLIQSQY